jgi:hypothetical protein
MAISTAATGGAGDDAGDRVRAAQTLVLGMGRTRFGPPDFEIERRIRSIPDLKQLEKLFSRLMEAASWQDLFSSE